MNIELYLENLENQIDPEIEDALQAQWEAFTEGRFTGDIFSPKRNAKRPASVDWPNISVNHAQEDLDAMVLQQYGACSKQLADGTGSMMTVRANYGTAIMPSMFGAELFVMEEKLNTLQTCIPLGAGEPGSSSRSYGETRILCLSVRMVAFRLPGLGTVSDSESHL